MILRFLLICSYIHYSVSSLLRNAKDQECLTGHMTDMQSWVDQYGTLNVARDDSDNSVDLSSRVNPIPMLQQTMLTSFKNQNGAKSRYVKYLSMARCQLNTVPPVFNLRDSNGRSLSSTLEYLTFFGNDFIGISSAGDQYESHLNATGATETTVTEITTFQTNTLWSSGFQEITFAKLKELDLRACSIQILSMNVFRGMRNLEAVYLGENEIYHIEMNAFAGLGNLRHLDLRENQGYDDDGKPVNLATTSYYIFQGLNKLESLDLSSTKLTVQNLGMVARLGNTLKSLSLCKTGLTSLKDCAFNETSLQVLDVSFNSGILSANRQNALTGLEKSLAVLYAKNVGLRTPNIFKGFQKLEILQLSSNELTSFPPSIAETLKRLKILDLDKNRITTWFNATFSLIPTLRYLSLQDNNINVISQELIEDVKNVDYVALSRNFMICNCLAKDLFTMASINEQLNDTSIRISKNLPYNKALDDYRYIIRNRIKIEFELDETCNGTLGDTGTFRLVDYSDDAYLCLVVEETVSVPFEVLDGCSKVFRDVNYEAELQKSHNRLLALLAIPCFLLPLMILFIFRRNLRYFCITMRNSAMLSLINKNETIDTEGTIFHYDVFVSYCNEDRGWVLDYLLPQIESDCSISACLHERDFQVGLSILENIVSCMDRSRSIMLVISQRFLLSQWCQFEMHLAQHRLLETRREDLTLVLLEEIPRRMRPNTLQYLMLTKTYIVWPKDESDRPVFWKRLKKSLVNKNKQGEDVSLA